MPTGCAVETNYEGVQMKTDTLRVLNEYPGSHHYHEIYELTEMYCPNCGVKGQVWEAPDGDYYVGGRSICTACFHEGHLMGGMSPIRDENVTMQAEQLKTGIVKEPSTRRGG